MEASEVCCQKVLIKPISTLKLQGCRMSSPVSGSHMFHAELRTRKCAENVAQVRLTGVKVRSNSIQEKFNYHNSPDHNNGKAHFNQPTGQSPVKEFVEVYGMSLSRVGCTSMGLASIVSLRRYLVTHPEN